MPAVDLAALIHAAATDVFVRRGFGVDALPAEIDLQRPRNRDHGDYATTLALRSAGRIGVAPRELAGWLADALISDDRIASAEVAGPGFVNVLLAATSRPTVIGDVLAAGERYGEGADLAGEVVTLTSHPADLAHARRATSDAALRRMLTARGARVVREQRDGAVPAAMPAVAPLRVLKAGLPVAMATMDDLVAAVGIDAARYSLVRTSLNVRLDLELDALARYNTDNPVFAVQYAHARLVSLSRDAGRMDLTRGDRYDLLCRPPDDELVRTVGEFPTVLGSAARRRDPHRVARYLEALAATYHRFDASCRVLPMGDELITELNKARLALCEATRQVLANGLTLLGVHAPERL
jgi:arginyl-tRNA synthetase